jgi:hypothetical protein
LEFLCGKGNRLVSAVFPEFNFIFADSYAAPEVMTRFSRGGGTLEDFQRADIFSFATLVWELIHRQIPWGEDATAEARFNLLCYPFLFIYFIIII